MQECRAEEEILLRAYLAYRLALPKVEVTSANRSEEPTPYRQIRSSKLESNLLFRGPGYDKRTSHRVDLIKSQFCGRVFDQHRQSAWTCPIERSRR